MHVETKKLGVSQSWRSFNYQMLIDLRLSSLCSVV